jgi:hypothetical protein
METSNKSVYNSDNQPTVNATVNQYTQCGNQKSNSIESTSTYKTHISKQKKISNALKMRHHQLCNLHVQPETKLQTWDVIP